MSVDEQMRVGKNKVRYESGAERDGVTWARAVTGYTREWDGGAKVRRGTWVYGYHVLKIGGK